MRRSSRCRCGLVGSPANTTISPNVQEIRIWKVMGRSMALGRLWETYLLELILLGLLVLAGFGCLSVQLLCCELPENMSVIAQTQHAEIRSRIHGT